MASILHEVGLERFWVKVGERRTLFIDGQAHDAADDTIEGAPIVVYGTGAMDAKSLIDVESIARVLHPTLPSHRFDAVCDVHRLPSGPEHETGSLAELLMALLHEALHTDPEVLSLLARLLPPATAAVFERIARADVLPVSRPPTTIQTGPSAETRAAPWRSVDEALSERGPIAAASLAYEVRDGQRQMAESVERAMSAGGALSVEAGPGTGKTFAYLVPAILHLERNPGDRVLVCTKTKQLQEQLYERDIPLLLASAEKSIRVALLKGRENYVCLRRWEALLHGGISDRLDGVDPLSVATLVRWIAETKTGDIDENAAFLSSPSASETWLRICDSPLHCTAAYCAHAGDCFSILARRRARAADLVVVNHSLLLSDRAAAGVVLGKYSRLIVDEAHAFEEAARNSFAVSLSRRNAERLASEIQPARRRRTGWLSRVPFPATDPDVQAVAGHIVALRSQVLRLFTEIGKRLGDAVRGTLPRWSREVVEFEQLAHCCGQIDDALRALAKRLEGDDAELAKQAEALAVGFAELSSNAGRLGRLPEENRVHWFERDRDELVLHSTPLDVAEILGRVLHPCLETLVLTSATLSLDGSFDYVHRALGIGAFDRVDRAVVPSPFSYSDRMRICVCTEFPDVVERDAYPDALASFLILLDRHLGRKGLVLFTSHELLRSVRDRIHRELPTLAQGLDGPRTKIVRRFRQQAESGLLLGTASFWEGVDLPGADVEYLVVTRLPFPVPTDPVQRALSTRAAQDGLDPFRSLSLPQAVLRLRQGVGRLIRTREDCGAVFMTDHRIVTRPYGRVFSAALPTTVEVHERCDAMVEDVAAWFGAIDRKHANG